MTPESLTTLAHQAAQASGAVQVILFGSVAQNKATRESDIDLLLVLPDDANLMEVTTRTQKALFPRSQPLDLVSMHQSHWREGASVLAREIAQNGIVLYG